MEVTAPVIISLFSLLFSIMAWRKSRTIYDVKRVVFYENPNNNKTMINANKMTRTLLHSGQYTILFTRSFDSQPGMEFVLGQLTREKIKDKNNR